MQTAHAIADFAYTFPFEFKKWKEESNSIISLSIKDENKLLEFCGVLDGKNIKFVKFFEPDVNEYTAICIEATEESRNLCKKFPLAGKRFLTEKDKLIHDMSKTFQFETQSVLEHGKSVWKYFEQIHKCLLTGETNGNLKIPQIFLDFAVHLTTNLHPLDIIKQYCIFHDCGKPYCLEYDSEGKKHFTDHANVSYQAYKKVFTDDPNTEIISRLIQNDMDIHLLKDSGVEDFLKKDKNDIITHLVVGLSELLSNAQMFGGYDSTSFKIKYKSLEQRAKKILKTYE